MKVSAPNEGSSVEHVQRRISPDTRLGTIHTGSRYVLGFGPDSYGIWDEFAKGTPVERFPATDKGRNAAWQRYVELEPEAQDAHEAYVAAGRSPVEEEGGRKRWPIIAAALVVVAGAIIGLVVARSGGGGGEQAGQGGGPVGKTAHIDVSGAETLSEDLNLSKFEASGTQAVFGGVVDATWKGPSSELRIELHSPTKGKLTMTQITFRAIDLTLTPGGASPGASPGTSPSPSPSPETSPGTSPGAGAIQLHSSHGECTIDVKTLSDTSFAGDFTCTGLTATGLDGTVDVKGSVAASS
jgi:hypothetical protein